MTTKTVTKPKRKVTVRKSPAKKKSKTQAKPKGLFYFDFTPAGRMLRAYFIALVTAQTGGKLKAGAPFKVKPTFNMRGHLLTGKIEKVAEGYAMTTRGINYFTDPEQQADPALLEEMTEAVTTGKQPKCYPHPLFPINN